MYEPFEIKKLLDKCIMSDLANIIMDYNYLDKYKLTKYLDPKYAHLIDGVQIAKDIVPELNTIFRENGFIKIWLPNPCYSIPIWFVNNTCPALSFVLFP